MRIGTFGQHSLETLLLHGSHQAVAVLERLRETHDAVRGIDELAQALPPFGQRQVEHRRALHFEQIEQVDDERPGTLLHGGEAGPALIVERTDLAVDDARRRTQRARQRAGNCIETAA